MTGTNEGEKKERAVSKVQNRSPKSKEKSTLVALASFANSDGRSCFPKVESVAERSGHSVRTTQNHIRALSSRCTWPRAVFSDLSCDFQTNAELRVSYQTHRWSRQNEYFIPICAEIMISKGQMKLPLKTREELSDISIERNYPGEEATKPLINKAETDVVLAKEQFDQINDPDARLEISVETQSIINSVTNRLRIARDYNVHFDNVIAS
jgi:hypothetical protein